MTPLHTVTPAKAEIQRQTLGAGALDSRLRGNDGVRGAVLTPREEDAQLRLDFAAFAQRCFRELNPLNPFAMNWHIEVMAAKLTAVYKGKIRRLIINKPYLLDNI